ncbi:hypothetical protein ACFLTH_04285 [Bacteroidota bacterium]
MRKMQISENVLMKKNKTGINRYPNLNTVLMVEDFLKNHRDLPISLADLRRKLPKQIMHQTIKVILQYLWQSGKIIYGPKGVQWIYVEPEHLRRMMKNTEEL